MAKLLIMHLFYFHLTYYNCFAFNENCGISTIDRSVKRIVGGTNAYYGEIPWQVLTAAHCRAGYFGSLRVILGGHNKDNLRNSNTIVMRINRMIIHPNFNLKTLDNDIALIELSYPISDAINHIRPICVPEFNENFDYRDAYVSGWGALSYGGRFPKILQIVNVPIIPNEECENMFSKAGFIKSINPTIVCAGHAEGEKDACDGDSGGPLTCKNEDGRWVLIGVVSSGIKCAAPNMPGIYTNIAYYVNWINVIIGNN